MVDERQERILCSDADVLAASQRHFGLVLGRVPTVANGVRA